MALPPPVCQQIAGDGRALTADCPFVDSDPQLDPWNMECNAPANCINGTMMQQLLFLRFDSSGPYALVIITEKHVI